MPPTWVALGAQAEGSYVQRGAHKLAALRRGERVMMNSAFRVAMRPLRRRRDMRMMGKWLVPLLAVAGIGFAAAAPATAEVVGTAMPPVGRDAAPLAAPQGADRERIIDAIQKRFAAKVLRVTETQADGHAALTLRLLSNQGGRVWDVVVDAQSGQVLSGG